MNVLRELAKDLKAELSLDHPLVVLMAEHDDLRKHKRDLLELANKANTMDTAAFKEKLNYLSQTIVSTLRASTKAIRLGIARLHHGTGNEG